MIGVVAAFDRDSFTSHHYDFLLAKNGPVAMFWKLSVLAEATEWLQSRGYELVTLDASRWTSAAEMHLEIASALDFPSHYGANLAALDDCLGEVVTYDRAASEEAEGFVLVLVNFDTFLGRVPKTAHALVDIYAAQARSGALIGHRMLCLVQSNDPDLRIEAVGGFSVPWNPAEWLDATRHPN